MATYDTYARVCVMPLYREHRFFGLARPQTKLASHRCNKDDFHMTRMQSVTLLSIMRRRIQGQVTDIAPFLLISLLWLNIFDHVLE